MHTPPTRQERMSALALARVESLADAIAQLPPLPPHTMPRPPEAGMVMARARTGNTGQAFHLGEVLVTRCTVCLQPSQPASAETDSDKSRSDADMAIMGHAWVRGRASRHARLAALLDALWQHPDYASVLDQYLWSRLTRERQESIHAAAAAVAPTRVDFFTLVRGEDEA